MRRAGRTRRAVLAELHSARHLRIASGPQQPQTRSQRHAHTRTHARTHARTCTQNNERRHTHTPERTQALARMHACTHGRTQTLTCSQTEAHGRAQHTRTHSRGHACIQNTRTERNHACARAIEQAARIDTGRRTPTHTLAYACTDRHTPTSTRNRDRAHTHTHLGTHACDTHLHTRMSRTVTLTHARAHKHSFAHAHRRCVQGCGVGAPAHCGCMAGFAAPVGSALNLKYSLLSL
jgi:hypothetical protein